MGKRAILAVSFGTSRADTCAKTIDAIEHEIRGKYPQYPLYRAWTSKIIRQKIEKRDGVHIFGVKEALEQMKKDGVTEVVVQPTYILNGSENERLEKELEEAGGFGKIIVSKPLLNTQEDNEKIVELLIREWKLSKDEMLVFMGHGTEHHSNFVYTALNDLFIRKGHKNMIVGTIEGYPQIDDVVKVVKAFGVHKVVLTPFMIVAGSHANQNLAGEGENSWKTIFEKEGYEVRCVLKGLGEYEGIRRMFVEHLAKAMEKGK